MELIRFSMPGTDNIRCAFTGRSDGILGGNISFQAGDDPLAVARRRQNLAGRLRRDGLRCWAECRQIHGVNIIVRTAPTPVDAEAASLEEADGMMTDIPGLGLMIKTADCQPLLVGDASGKHIMALHVGWRGNRANFPAIAVRAFCGRYDLDPASLWAVRGPSLGPLNSEFVNFDSEWGPDFDQWRDAARQTVDLWKMTGDQLAAAGLPESHVFGLPICTFANYRQWFSHRRRHAGRQAALVWIVPTADQEAQ